LKTFFNAWDAEAAEKSMKDLEERIKIIASDLSGVAADASAAFGRLSAEQLNWKPSEAGWSVAQCLDHLIRTNNEMLQAIDAKVAGAGNSFWENWSPLTGFLGRFLTNGMRTDSKKFKAPSKSIVPPSDIAANIVEQFAAHQLFVAEKVNGMAALDWDRTVITSPFVRLMTYKLGDGVDILVEHERRHIRQAKRVTETVGFPS
jgi:hypothetical protein